MTAQVPPTPDFNTPDAGLGRWVSAVNTALKALRDAKLITQDDIDSLTRKANETLNTKRAASAADVVVGLGGVIPITDLVAKLVVNQQFKDAIKTTPGTTTAPAPSGGANATELSTLEQGVNAAAKRAEAAAKEATAALADLSRIKKSRGPISSVGVAASWSDLDAGRCIYWMAFNGGTTVPTWPTNIEPFLVVGDRVTIRSSLTNPSTFMETKQYLGPDLGWVATPYSVDFNDVINLPTFLTNVNAVINSSLQLVSSTVIAGTGKTLAQVASYRSPIINVCHVGGGTGLPVTLDPDVASWTVLYILNGYVNPGFRAGMPTAYLIYGDTITFIDDGTGSAFGALSWNGSSWV